MLYHDEFITLLFQNSYEYIGGGGGRVRERWQGKMFRCMCTCVCLYNPVAFKVCYHVLVVIFPMPHDGGCEIKIIVIDTYGNRTWSLVRRPTHYPPPPPPAASSIPKWAPVGPNWGPYGMLLGSVGLPNAFIALRSRLPNSVLR